MIWKRLVEDHASPLVHPTAYNLASVRNLPLLGAATLGALVEFKNKSARWCYAGPSASEVFVEEGKAALKKLAEPAFVEELQRLSRETVAALLEKANTIREQELYSLDNKQLAAAFDELLRLWIEMNVWGHVVNVTDFDHFMLTKKINSLLENKIKESGAETTVPEAFAILTTPLEKTPLSRQDRDFFRLLAMIQADSIAREVFKQPTQEVVKQMEEFPEIDHAIHEHAHEYGWLQFHYDGPTVLNEDYFVEALAAEVRQGVDGMRKLNELQEKHDALANKQLELEEALELSREEKQLIHATKTLMFLKVLRKDAVFQASCWSDGLINEIATRLSLDPVQVRHLTPEEIGSALRGGRKVNARDADERVRYSCWLYEKDKPVQIFTGEKARQLAAQIIEDRPHGDVRELRGTPSSPGYAKGVVKLVARIEDIPKMNKGDILISPATNPNLVPAMKKAAAIITDEGGITCHAAIISRELGIPCIVGTKIVTKAFKDGDLVEVDASKGVVRKL